MSSFADLDLSSVETQGEGSLAPGRYEAEVQSAAMQPTASGSGSMLVVKLVVQGEGAVVDRMNLFNKNEETVRIARERLKTMLTYAGHPNPNKPEDVSSLRGLRVGINVVKGKEWTDKDGNLREGGSELKRSGAFYDLSSSPAAPTAKKELSDEIPF